MYPNTGKIHVVSPSVIRYGIRKDPHTTPGLYNAEKGKIILNNQNWCLSTLIHETLHSLSNFSRIYSTLESQEFPCEGMTEFLTGQFLCSFSDSLETIVNNNCCRGWKPPNGCYLSRYRTDIMIFYFIAQKIGLRKIFSIYLDPTIENPNLKLVEELRNQDIPFEDIFTGYSHTIVLRRRIQDELTKCYPAEFPSFMRQTDINFNIVI